MTYEHHSCTERGCNLELRYAHMRATANHRARVIAKIRGHRPRIRARRHTNSLGWARLRLDLIEFSVKHDLTMAEFDHVRREVMRSGRLESNRLTERES